MDITSQELCSTTGLQQGLCHCNPRPTQTHELKDMWQWCCTYFNRYFINCAWTLLQNKERKKGRGDDTFGRGKRRKREVELVLHNPHGGCAYVALLCLICAQKPRQPNGTIPFIQCHLITTSGWRWMKRAPYSQGKFSPFPLSATMFWR